jgi:hypothetical protein
LSVKPPEFRRSTCHIATCATPVKEVITLRNAAREDDYSVHPEIKEAGNIAARESRVFMWFSGRKQAQRGSRHDFPLGEGPARVLGGMRGY